MEAIKKAFRSVTNVSSWDEAVQRFPNHSSPSVCHLSFQKTIPQSFISFCQSALQQESITDSSDHLALNDVLAFVVKVSFKEATLDKIRSLGHDKFMGAHLSLVKLTKESTHDEIKQFIYISRHINTLPERSVAVYNFIVLCDISVATLVGEMMKDCYSRVTTLYSFNKTEESSSKPEFVCKVGAVVIGHFSIDPEVDLYQEHINIKSSRSDVFEYTDDFFLYEQLVKAFSFVGQVVLDGTETELVSVAAIKQKRNTVALAHTDLNIKELLEKY